MKVIMLGDQPVGTFPDEATDQDVKKMLTAMVTDTFFAKKLDDCTTQYGFESGELHLEVVQVTSFSTL